MNTIAVLLIAVVCQDATEVLENLVKYFASAEQTKLNLVAEQTRYLDVAELKTSSMTGRPLALQNRKIASIKSNLKQARESIPHAFVSGMPIKGEVGMLETVTTLAIIDSKSVLAVIDLGDGDLVNAILIVDQSSRLKSMRINTPDYVFHIVEVGESSTDAKTENEAHRKSLSLCKTSRFNCVTAEYVKKADLVKHRNAWEASRKEADKN